VIAACAMGVTLMATTMHIIATTHATLKLVIINRRKKQTTKQIKTSNIMRICFACNGNSCLLFGE